MPTLPYTFPFLWGVIEASAETLDVIAGLTTDGVAARQVDTSTTVTAEQTAAAVAAFAAWADTQSLAGTDTSATADAQADSSLDVTAAPTGVFGRILVAAAQLASQATTSGEILRGQFGDASLSMVWADDSAASRDARAVADFVVAWLPEAGVTPDRSADADFQAVAQSDAVARLTAFLLAQFDVDVAVDGSAFKSVEAFTSTVVLAGVDAAVRAAFIADGVLAVTVESSAGSVLALSVGGQLVVTALVGAPSMNLPLGQLNAVLQVAVSTYAVAFSPFFVAFAEAVSRAADAGLRHEAAQAPEDERFAELTVDLRSVGVNASERMAFASPPVTSSEVSESDRLAFVDESPRPSSVQ